MSNDLQRYQQQHSQDRQKRIDRARAEVAEQERQQAERIRQLEQQKAELQRQQQLAQWRQEKLEEERLEREQRKNERREKWNTPEVRQLRINILFWVMIVGAVLCGAFTFAALGIMNNAVLLIGKITFVIALVTALIWAFLFRRDITDWYDDHPVITIGAAIAIVAVVIVAAGIWHKPYQISDTGVIYYETDKGVAVVGIEDGATEVEIENSYNGIAVISVKIAKGKDVAELTLHTEANNHEIGKNFFKKCKNLERLTLVSVNSTSIAKKAVKDLPKLKSVVFSGGSFALNENAFLDCRQLRLFEVRDTTVNNTPGVSANVIAGSSQIDFTLHNGKVNLSMPVVSTLRLSGTCEFRTYGDTNSRKVDTVIFEEDFDYEYSKISKTRTEGVFNPVTTHVALAGKYYIPASAGMIPNSVFGDIAAECQVFYQGSKEQWNSLKVGEHNGNLSSGKIRLEYGAEMPVS